MTLQDLPCVPLASNESRLSLQENFTVLGRPKSTTSPPSTAELIGLLRRHEWCHGSGAVMACRAIFAEKSNVCVHRPTLLRACSTLAHFRSLLSSWRESVVFTMAGLVVLFSREFPPVSTLLIVFGLVFAAEASSALQELASYCSHDREDLSRLSPAGAALIFVRKLLDFLSFGFQQLLHSAILGDDMLGSRGTLILHVF